MTDPGISQKLDQLFEIPVSEFVLHRPPMFLLDRLVSLDLESAICEWCVRQDNEFMVPDLGVPAYIGIEYMAQCMAVHSGACARLLDSLPPQGFLLGTRQYNCDVPYFILGSSYQVSCRMLVSNLDGLCSFECQIFSNNQVIAQARISVLQKTPGEAINE
jgi:predicted hotdog family 3-hydroxylacyl-ACP dehydratase